MSALSCPSKSPLNHPCTLEEGHKGVHRNDHNFPRNPIIYWQTSPRGSNQFFCDVHKTGSCTFAEDFRNPCRCINCYLTHLHMVQVAGEKRDKQYEVAEKASRSLERMLDLLAQERRRIQAVRELASKWAKQGTAKVEGGYELQANMVLSQLKGGAGTREFVLEDEQLVTCASCDKTHSPGTLEPRWAQLLLGRDFIPGLEYMTIDVCSPECLQLALKELLTKKGEDDIA